MDRRIDWALNEVDLLLGPLGRRHAHVRAVGRRAEEIGEAVVGGDAPTLVLAAYLHDIGYAPDLAVTGFHPLDGARYLRKQGYDDIAGLVAHHTGARNEARLRGLPELEEEFPFEDSLLQRTITYCDVTTGPDGRRIGASQRAEEIVQRYGEDDVVSRAIMIGLPEFLAIEQEIEAILSGSPASTRSDSR